MPTEKVLIFSASWCIIKGTRELILRVITMTAMTIERAVDNAIVSTEMEGFVITEKHKELIMKLMNKEITLSDALKELNNKDN